MDTKLILQYLTELKNNNSREFYHAHKEEFKYANEEFKKLLKELILQIGRTDSSVLHNDPKDLTFKLMRDTRFSHDKSPYNPSFRAHIGPCGKLPIPAGYYIMLAPDGRSFLGGGLFADMFKDATAMVRSHIAANTGEWKRILSDPQFQKYFTVRGTALKKVPEGFDPKSPQAEYLKYKSWYLEYPVSDQMVCDSGQFIKLAEAVFQAMQHFNAFINRALAGFVMPQRG